MLNVLVPKVSLKRPCVMPLVRQRVTTGVPEHVGVCLERQLRPLPRPLDHSGEPGRAEGCPAFRGEHEGSTFA
jgi:hypothetical protein